MWSWLLATVALADPPSSNSALESVLAAELDRAVAVLGTREEKPHYVSLQVEDVQTVTITARDGTLAQDDAVHNRYLDVDLRTGTPDLDNTHPLRGFSVLAEKDREAVPLPVEDDGYALQHAVWRALDSAYRTAAERIVVLRANHDVKVEEEDPAPDFEPRAPVVDHREVPALELDQDAWRKLLVEMSDRIDRTPEVQRGVVVVQADRLVQTFVDTEGTRLVHGRRHARVSINLSSVAADGDDVNVFDAVDVHDPSALPDREALVKRVDEAIANLKARLVAPRADPYSGPVLLTGRAAGVFFHEVLGHRVEGHRQKRDDEGKTFGDQVGKPVLPPWMNVDDDATVEHLAGEDLNGFYAYDDEGVPAQKVPLVDKGVFVGFLMSRSPIPKFPHSNGHGRRSPGHSAEARMGNTLVTATKTLAAPELRRKLLDEIKQQGLAYGYIVTEIEGGFTETGRVTPNAFNVRATSTLRVYADGRPDELVRGIDLVGTPLVAFHNLEAAGADLEVFNGVCGSDSGWVPVSAVAPSVLFSRLEFQLKEKGEERPPLLAKPEPAVRPTPSEQAHPTHTAEGTR